MPEKTFVPCPKCGADLPPEASFCPYCTESFNPRTELHPPDGPGGGSCGGSSWRWSCSPPASGSTWPDCPGSMTAWAR